MEPTNPLPSLKPNRSNAEELGSFKIIHVDPGSGDRSLHAVNSKSTSEYKIVYYEARQTNRHKTPSEVWKYFALATKDTSPSMNSDEVPDDRILCMLCYSKGRVHVYKSKTSSSNLWKHLNRKHNIEIPTEKMFAIPSAKYEVYDFDGDGDVDEVGEGLVENSQEANSTDDQLSAVDINDTEQIVIKADDFEEGSNFQVEEIVERPMQENFQNGDAIVKLELNSTGPVFKDIGLIIIEEVSKRPVLYEMLSNKSPSLRANRELMWAEVYDALGEIIPIDRIQKIWKNIRERYRKLRNAEKNGLSDSSKKYKYYNQLRFLDACSTFDQSSDNSLDEPPEKKFRTEDLNYPNFMMEQHDNLPYTVDEFDQQNYITEEIIQDSNCTVSSSNPPMRNTLCPIEIVQSTFDDTTIKHSPTSSPFHHTEQVDEFDLFGKLIAKKLRAAPKERVNLIELKIMQAILENS